MTQTPLVSQTATFHPPVGAVDGADEILGKGRIWHPTRNDPKKAVLQKEFLAVFTEARTQLSLIPEMFVKASRSAEELNALLQREGFTIRLDPFPKPEDFGVVAVLKVLEEWLYSGTKRALRINDSDPKDNTSYTCARLFDGITQSHVHGHDNPVVTIKTKTTDLVHMTRIDAVPSHTGLLKLGTLMTQNQSAATRIDSLTFPMVELDQEVDISWLINLWTKDASNKDFWKIAQAKQQTKFRMNEKGAKVESAAAIGIVRTTSVRRTVDVTMNGPFLLAITRPGLSHPLFVGHLCPDVWREPKEL